MGSPKASPAPAKKTEAKVEKLTFYEALSAIKEGKKVTKLEWNSKDIYGYILNTHLTLHKEDGDHDWVITENDFVLDDYVILN